MRYNIDCFNYTEKLALIRDNYGDLDYLIEQIEQLPNGKNLIEEAANTIILEECLNCVDDDERLTLEERNR